LWGRGKKTGNTKATGGRRELRESIRKESGMETFPTTPGKMTGGRLQPGVNPKMGDSHSLGTSVKGGGGKWGSRIPYLYHYTKPKESKRKRARKRQDCSGWSLRSAGGRRMEPNGINLSKLTGGGTSYEGYLGKMRDLTSWRGQLHS